MRRYRSISGLSVADKVRSGFSEFAHAIRTCCATVISGGQVIGQARPNISTCRLPGESGIERGSVSVRAWGSALLVAGLHRALALCDSLVNSVKHDVEISGSNKGVRNGRPCRR